MRGLKRTLDAPTVEDSAKDCELSVARTQISNMTRDVWRQCDELGLNTIEPYPRKGIKQQYPLLDQIRELRHKMRSLNSLEKRVHAKGPRR